MSGRRDGSGRSQGHPLVADNVAGVFVGGFIGPRVLVGPGAGAGLRAERGLASSLVQNLWCRLAAARKVAYRTE